MNRGHGACVVLAWFSAMAGVWAFGGCSSSDSANNGGAPDSGRDAIATDDAGDDDDAGPPSCETYCNEVAAHCRGDVRDVDISRPDAATAQYSSTAGCLHACANMASGKQGDESGDSVACRQYHAGQPASVDPVTHCPHSGVAGGSVCSDLANLAAGGRCASFCRSALKLCAPAVLADAGLDGAVVPFESEQACLDACGHEGPGKFDFDHTRNELTRNGNSLNCRQFHLSVAYTDPATDNGRATPSAITECPKLRPSFDAGATTDDNPCSGP